MNVVNKLALVDVVAFKKVELVELVWFIVGLVELAMLVKSLKKVRSNELVVEI